MFRLFSGLIKGAVLGAAVGFGALKAGLGGGATAYFVLPLVGALVGVLCGRPPWRQETIWTSVTKGIFGALIAAGLTWVARRFLGGLVLPVPAAFGLDGSVPAVSVPVYLGAAIGALYGAFVEIDDGGAAKAAAKG